MLGKHGIGNEGAGLIELSFGDDALAFAEKIGQLARIDDRHCLGRIGHDELDCRALVAHEASLLDEPAEPDAFPRLDMLLGDFARCVEEHDRVAQGIEDEAGREPKDCEARENQREALLFASHGRTPIS